MSTFHTESLTKSNIGCQTNRLIPANTEETCGKIRSRQAFRRRQRRHSFCTLHFAFCTRQGARFIPYRGRENLNANSGIVVIRLGILVIHPQSLLPLLARVEASRGLEPSTRQDPCKYWVFEQESRQETRQVGVSSPSDPPFRAAALLRTPAKTFNRRQRSEQRKTSKGRSDK